MRKLRQRVRQLVASEVGKNEEFQAPQWVQDDADPAIENIESPLTQKHKYFLRATLIVVIPFCLWAGWFEFGRAHQGHWRAWVYAFEWPFFGVVALYMYRRFMRGDMPQIPRPDLKAFAALDSHEKEIIKERE